MNERQKNDLSLCHAFTLQETNMTWKVNKIWEEMLDSKDIYARTAAGYFLGKNKMNVGMKDDALGIFKRVSADPGLTKYASFSNEQSPIIIVISTLVIAALFNPLRIRVQDFIDRHFYRRKYDAHQALDDFASTARDEVEMDKLTAALLVVVEDTVQPDMAVLWLKKIDRSTSYER